MPRDNIPSAAVGPLLGLPARDSHPVRVDHDNEVAHVDVRRVLRLVLATRLSARSPSPDDRRAFPPRQRRTRLRSTSRGRAIHLSLSSGGFSRTSKALRQIESSRTFKGPACQPAPVGACSRQHAPAFGCRLSASTLPAGQLDARFATSVDTSASLSGAASDYGFAADGYLAGRYDDAIMAGYSRSMFFCELLGQVAGEHRPA